MPTHGKASEYHLQEWRVSLGKQTPPALYFCLVWAVLLFEVDEGKFMLGSFPISFEEGDLYLVSFNRTENVVFFETIVHICAKMQIDYYFKAGERHHNYLNIPRESQDWPAHIFPSGDYQILLSI